jgi:hypothetical protein
MYWKVEEYEPVHPHLRAGMSPPPTRLNRRNADDEVEHIGRHASEGELRCSRLARGHGENAARPWHRHRLAESKGKDCDRQPRQYEDVQHMNEGRHDGMPTMFCIARELTLMSIMLAEFP